MATATKEPTLQPVNQAKLTAQANTQVDQEIQGQVDPLQSLADQYLAQEDKGVAQVDQLYTDPATGINQQTRHVADDLKSNWSNLNQNQNAIFSEASNRLNMLRQQQAQEAQTLSQQLGAPVPISSFAGVTDQEIGRSTSEFAGGMLNAMGLASSGVQQAEAYAGTVFPMMRARQTAEVKSFFNDKITKLQDEIASIKGQKAGLVSKRQRELLVQDREFSLEKLKSDRDMYLAKQQLAESKATRKFNEKQLSVNDANADADRVASTSKADKDRKSSETIAREQIKAQKAAKSTGLTPQQIRTNALQYVNALLSPGSQKVSVEVNKADGTIGYEDKLEPGIPAMNPNRMVDQILSSPGVGRTKDNKEFIKWLENQVRVAGKARGKDWSTWSYGKYATGDRSSITVQGSRGVGSLDATNRIQPWSLKSLRSAPLKAVEDYASELFGWTSKPGTKNKVLITLPSGAQEQFKVGNFPTKLKSDTARRDWLASQVYIIQERLYQLQQQISGA